MSPMVPHTHRNRSNTWRLAFAVTLTALLFAALVTAGAALAALPGGKSAVQTASTDTAFSVPRPEHTGFAGGVAGASPTSTATGTPVCGLQWRTVTGPNTGRPANDLYGVSALSSADVWAVGYQSAQTGRQPLIAHWDGSTWNVMPTPAVTAVLRGVAALSPNEVWAVGYYTNANQEVLGTIVLHWDGIQWSTVPAPSPTTQSLLYGIAAVTADDIWAVGSSGPGVLILHWDGDAWDTSPPPTSNGTVLSGVTALSANDVWAVGTQRIGPFDVYPLAMHWDGSQWSVVPTPALSDTGLRAVDAVAPNDIWAVGTNSTWGSPVAMHWDGNQWSDVPNPAPGNISNALLGVTAVASHDVWAVGVYESSTSGGSKAMMQHWNGSAWTVYPTLDPAARIELYAVAHASPADVWAVGRRYTGTFTHDPLVARYSDPCAGGTPVPTSTGMATSTPAPTGTSMATSTSVPTNTRTPSTTVAPTHTQVPTATACTLTFADVPADNTFYPFVRCLACQGIINGYPCGGPGEPCNANDDPYFRPNNYVTRGQLAKIVSESAGFEDEVPPSQWTFTDVSYGSTFWVWVERLSNREVMGGYTCGGPNEPCDGQNRPYFRPGAGATRGQLTKIVSNAAGFDDAIPQTQYNFADVEPGSTFWLYVERLLLNRPGVMGGYPCGGAGEPCDTESRPYFRPGNPLTRGQTSKIVANTFFPGCQMP